MTQAALSRPSARSRAKRPQLVPRETPTVVDPAASGVPSGWRGTKAAAPPDLDAVAAQARGTDGGGWQNDEMLRDGSEPLPKPETPAPTPLMTLAAPTPAVTSSLALRPITYEDIDRLWDWARADLAGATKFLGAMPTHSKALYDYIGKLLEAEHLNTALVRAIDLASETGSMHVGFIVLNPISRTTKQAIGMVHCYLAPFVQGSLPQMLPVLLDIAAEQEPDLTLMVATTDYAFAKLLQPHGFTLSIALTRPPANTRK